MDQPHRINTSAMFRVPCAIMQVLCFCLLGTATGGWAREKNEVGEPYRFFSMQRGLGAVLVVGGGILAKQGFQYKEQADAFYDRYQQADEPQEADRLYRRSADRDVKSQVSWALSAALATGGLRLLLSDSPAITEGRHENAGRAQEGLFLKPRVDQRGNSLILCKIWGFR